MSLRVDDYVDPTSTVRLRFSVSDVPNDSITEAGIDGLRIDRILCGGGCPADVDGSGTVDVEDLILVVLAWGTGDPAADVDGNGIVNVQDLVTVVLAWGKCPA